MTSRLSSDQHQPKVNPMKLFTRHAAARVFFAVLLFFALLLVARADDTNTKEGKDALKNDHGPNSGQRNSAFGYNALYSNKIGNDNTAVGYQSLFSDTGDYNTAIGFQALSNNTNGPANTACGYAALFSNTAGVSNTAVGDGVLYNNTTGSDNTAIGDTALFSNTTGQVNVASGLEALSANTTGSGNTAYGRSTLDNNSTGNRNIGLGYFAGVNLTTGDDNIDIGNFGVQGEGSTIRIGTLGTHNRTFIAGIRGTTTEKFDAISVVIDSSGQLGTISSSVRFKNDIKSMDASSEALLSLRPVTFHYKNDSGNTPQFGLIAEEVAQVNPGLVVRDANGKIYTVRYDAVNAMLLNEFLKEHKKVEQLEATAVQQQKQIEMLTAGLQKVSAQVELRQSSPQMAINNPQSRKGE
jgi:Chaperone of endosialidase